MHCFSSMNKTRDLGHLDGDWGVGEGPVSWWKLDDKFLPLHPDFISHIFGLDAWPPLCNSHPATQSQNQSSGSRVMGTWVWILTLSENSGLSFPQPQFPMCNKSSFHPLVSITKDEQRPRKVRGNQECPLSPEPSPPCLQEALPKI